MPQMSGRELADELKALNPDVRVLYMSGFTDDAVVRYGISSGRTAFLQKPFSEDSLVHAVRMVLDEPIAAGARH
jgi:DNA-binding NarL/FixJ family response regulator